MRKITALLFIVILLTATCCAYAEEVPERSNLAVYLDGVRIGFYSSDNQALNTYNIDGEVYVPLIPLLETLSIQYTVTDKAIQISGSGEAAPAEAPKAELKRVDITPENFEEYFDISYGSSGLSSYTTKDALGLPNTHFSGDVDIAITARMPFEIHDVRFNVQLTAYRAGKCIYPNFSGVISQAGSYSSSYHAAWESALANQKSLTVYSPKVISASGYIMISD